MLMSVVTWYSDSLESFCLRSLGRCNYNTKKGAKQTILQSGEEKANLDKQECLWGAD